MPSPWRDPEAPSFIPWRSAEHVPSTGDPALNRTTSLRSPHPPPSSLSSAGRPDQEESREQVCSVLSDKSAARYHGAGSLEGAGEQGLCGN